MKNSQLNCAFGIIEIIVAMAIFIIISVTAVSTAVHSFSLNRQSIEEASATFLAREGLEAVRSLKKQSWLNLADGTYGLDNALGYWEFSGNNNTYEKFTRELSVATAQRDCSGLLVNSGGVADIDTKKITSRVVWNFSPARPRVVELESYLTRWEKPLPHNGFAFITSDQVLSGTNVNSAASPLILNPIDINSTYYTFNSSNPTRLLIERQGNYFLALTVPVARLDTAAVPARIQAEVWINGIKSDYGIGRSALTTNIAGHSESSAHLNIVLPSLSVGDYLEFYLQGIAAVGPAYSVSLSDRASIFLEYLPDGEALFSASSTATSTGTNLNSASAPLLWQHTEITPYYSHSNSENTQDITINAAGNYLVYLNIPLEGIEADTNVLGRVFLDSSEVLGGRFSQGYIQGLDGDTRSSIHWSGVLKAEKNQLLSVVLEGEAAPGLVTTGAETASIFIRQLPVMEAFFTSGNLLAAGADWNPATGSDIIWSSDHFIDNCTYTHSSPSHLLTIEKPGDYLLVYTDSLTSPSGYPNSKITITVNGTPVPGGLAGTHYISGQSGHDESSASLVYFLNNLVPGDNLSLNVSREADDNYLTNNSEALLLLWKRQ